MKRDLDSESIDNPAAGDHPFERADLVFYGVDHSGPSFEARVYLNKPDADITTDRGDPAYAGSFTIFGHAGCAGDEGHCAITRRAALTCSTAGRRTASPRRPWTVIVTDSLRRVTEPELVVTVVGVRPGAEGPVEDRRARCSTASGCSRSPSRRDRRSPVSPGRGGPAGREDAAGGEGGRARRRRRPRRRWASPRPVGLSRAPGPRSASTAIRTVASGGCRACTADEPRATWARRAGTARG